MTDEQKTPASPNNATKPAGAEALEKVKAHLTVLPLWEKLTLGGGVLYLLGIFVFKYAKVTTSGSSSLGDYGRASYTLAKDGGFWFYLALVVAVVAILLPFLEKVMPSFKLPYPKSLICFVAGIVGIITPLVKWVSIEDKSVSYWGITIKLSPDLGFFIMLAGAALITYGAFQAGGLKQLQGVIKSFQKPASPPPTVTPQA